MSKPSRYVNPYNSELHQKYRIDGFCPSIHRSKVWCSLKVGHGGLHRAPKIKGKSFVWTDDDEHDR